MNIDDYYPYQTEEMERRMSEQQRPFKVGDRVFDLVRGHGVVTTVHYHVQYPICAVFEGELNITYTEDGRYYTKDQRPRLYHADSGDIVISTESPLPELEVDDVVWVRSDVTEEWIPQHFAQWKCRGCSCWRQGQTSHTTDSKICWRYWSLTKPESNE